MSSRTKQHRPMLWIADKLVIKKPILVLLERSSEPNLFSDRFPLIDWHISREFFSTRCNFPVTYVIICCFCRILQCARLVCNIRRSSTCTLCRSSKRGLDLPNCRNTVSTNVLNRIRLRSLISWLVSLTSFFTFNLKIHGTNQSFICFDISICLIFNALYA